MFKDKPKTLGERIKLARQNADKSRADIAKHFGITVQAVGAWERNESSPDYKTLAEFAKLTRVTTDWLLGVQEELPASIIRAAARSRAERLVNQYRDLLVEELTKRIIEDYEKGIPSEAERTDDKE